MRVTVILVDQRGRVVTSVSHPNAQVRRQQCEQIASQSGRPIANPEALVYA
jgi:hypothetical protein